MADETKTLDINDTSEEQADGIELPKEDWVEKAIEYEATPRSLRVPKTDREFYKQLGIKESTYYYTIAKKENQDRIIDLCFRQAKKRTPNILKKLGEKAEEGNDTSIAQFLEYILEIKKRIDITTGGEKVKGVVILPQKNEDTLESPAEAGESIS
jgi:hypothetical protein